MPMNGRQRKTSMVSELLRAKIVVVDLFDKTSPVVWNASASQPILLQSPPCEEWSDVGPSTSKIEEEGHRIAAASL